MSEPRPEHLAEAEAKTGIDPIYARQLYGVALPKVRQVAAEHGYAIGVHGSMKRDLDLIAAPWTDGAAAPEIFVKAVAVAVSGFIRTGKGRDDTGATARPHGRLAWTIHLGGGPYIDLSVMPLAPEAR